MPKSAILLGSKPASVVALLSLLRRGWDVKQVVTSSKQHDWISKPSLYHVSKQLGIKTVENQENIETDNVDLVISYMCRSLVKPKTLAKGKYPLNFHAGLLPEFGGWAFYNVAILENSPVYGCTCHVMDESFDTGPIVKTRSFAINPKHETALSLERKAQIEMILLFEDVISSYETTGILPMEKQNPLKMRYLNATEFALLKEIPYDATAEEVDKIARAFWYPPYEIAYIKTSSGAKVEVIPKIAKDKLAHMLHEEDLLSILRVDGFSSQEISSILDLYKK